MHSGTEWERTIVEERDIKSFDWDREKKKVSYKIIYTYVYTYAKSIFNMLYVLEQKKGKEIFLIYLNEFFKLKLLTFYPIVVDFFFAIIYTTSIDLKGRN